MWKTTSYKNLGSKGTFTILKKPGSYNEMTNEEDKIQLKKKRKRAKEFWDLTSCSEESESYFKSPFLLVAKPRLSF